MARFWAVVALATPALGAITADEARCVLKDRKVAFFGDSISRYCYFGLNNFLATGALRSAEFGTGGPGNTPWGDGPGGLDYDGGEPWNENGVVTDQGTQRQHFWKAFDAENIRTDFYFIQTAWYDGDPATPLEAETRVGDATVDARVAGDATLADVAASLDADVVV